MPTMKVTPDAAMRARDVSRPHDDEVRWAEEAEASVTAAADAVTASDVAARSRVETEAGHWSARAERGAMAPAPAPAPAEADIPDSESPGSEDRPADAGRVDGSRRRRVRSFRSSSRRGRPSR
jgi:hypothetical protein